MYTPKCLTYIYITFLCSIFLQLSICQELTAQNQTLRAITDFVVKVNDPMTFNVLNNDTGIDNKAIEVTDFNQPLWGKISYNGDGVFVYNADVDIWFDLFSYTICEVGNPNNCDDGTVILLVNQCSQCNDEPEEPVCATDFFGVVVVALPNKCWANCLEMEITNDEECPEILELIEQELGCDCESTDYEPVCVTTPWGDKTFANSCFAECWGFDNYAQGDCEQNWDYGCFCEGSFEPVCVNEAGNEWFFNNSCEAYCEGFTEQDFTACSTNNQEYDSSQQDWYEWIDDNICNNDCVWAGDANHDGIVNHYDLLEIGNAYGSQGIARSLSTLDWMPQLAWDWEQTTPNGVNYKHLDTNGDGIINKEDVDVIEQNYGLTHGEGTTPTVVNDSMFVSLKMPTDSIYLDTTLYVPIMVGSSDNMAVDFQGTAFEIAYDNGYFPEGTIDLDFDNTWVGLPEDLLTMVRIFPEKGIVEAAITRINASTVTGFGQVGKISIVAMEENLAGKKQIEQIKAPFGLGAKRSLGREEKIKTVEAIQNTLVVSLAPKDSVAIGNEEVISSSTIKVYPNPCVEQLNIAITESLIPSTNYTLEMCNVVGQRILQQNLIIDPQQQIHIPVTNYQKGIYFLMIKNAQQEVVFMEKVLLLDNN